MPRRRRDDDDSSPPPPRRQNRGSGGNSAGTKSKFAPANRTNEAESEIEMEPVPMWKTIAVVVVVVGCFVAVYPKMFHPMLMYALGYNTPTQKEPDRDRFPHPGARHGPPPGRMPTPDPHMHSGPPPHMRMGPQAGPAEAQKGSSKAMWHWMLPFYTVGVIIFLLYTLGKIFWKQPRRGERNAYNFKYNTTRDRFEVNKNNGSEEDEDDEPEGGVDLDDDYDDDKPSRGALNDKELRRLQGRLQETESAMHKILTQLEQLSGTVDPSTAENLKRMTLETLNDIGDIGPEKRTERNKKSKKPAEDESKPYIKDLEKALSDFKKFTENYIEEHTKKDDDDDNEPDGEENLESQTGDKEDSSERVEAKSRPKTNGLKNREKQADASEGEEENVVFDAMEDEDLNNLTVQNGEGELINVETDIRGVRVIDDKSQIRKRKPKPSRNPVKEEE